MVWICLLFAVIGVGHAEPIRVACVGNSVTYGYGLADREVDSYPAQLQRLLGERFQVENFGHSGATLLRRGYRPYMEQPAFREALRFAGEQVVIHLGLNDTDPRAWPNYRDDFVQDYIALIDSFRKANPACKIWICRMTPIFHSHPRFKSGTRDWFWMEQRLIEEVSRATGAGLIDLHTPLYNRPDLFPDALHPTAEGAALLAKAVYSALSGDYGGLQMPAIYTDGMILQRERPLPIGGIANRGERVVLSLAGQQRETRAGDDGRWQVVFDPLQASAESYTLTITSPSRTLVYRDIRAGEVWLCSGQSNMAFRVEESEAEERTAMLDYAGRRPDIRLFNMKARWETTAVAWNSTVLDSLNRLNYFEKACWRKCDVQEAARFSAIGWAFGRMLSDSLQVPIGLVLNAVGGAPTEAWIDRKSLEFAFPDLLMDRLENDFIQGWVRERAALNIKHATNRLQRHPYEPAYLFEAGIEPLCRFPLRGIIWYQGESNAHNMEAHEKLFPLLVKSWRHYWGKRYLFIMYSFRAWTAPLGPGSGIVNGG